MSSTAGPHPALRRLQPLVGTWAITGRSLGAKEDDITGLVVISWLPGGFFQEQRGEIEIPRLGLKVQSLEIVGYDVQTDTFRAQSYTNLGGEPGTYWWDVRGNAVTHWTKEARYTGILSEDGNTLSGGWRPMEGKGNAASAYDAVMTRVK